MWHLTTKQNLSRLKIRNFSGIFVAVALQSPKLHKLYNLKYGNLKPQSEGRSMLVRAVGGDNLFFHSDEIFPCKNKKQAKRLTSHCHTLPHVGVLEGDEYQVTARVARSV